MLNRGIALVNRRNTLLFLQRIGFLAMLLGVVVLGATRAYAGEGGGSRYLPGFLDTMSGVLQPPGWYADLKVISYSATTSRAAMSGQPTLDLRLHDAIEIGLVRQVTDYRLWGSYYAWEVLLPWETPHLEGRTNGVLQFNERTSAEDDLILVPLLLGWHYGDSHQRAQFVIYTNWGNYNVNRILNTGRNSWALEADYAFTYYNLHNGWEVSVAPGYTVNFINPATHYLSGQELHVDYTVLQHFSPTAGAGLAGYYFQQTTGDSGAGAIFGPFKGRTEALGPILSYTIRNGNTPITLVGKYYSEFAVRNRFAGHSFWFVVRLPI